MLKKTKIGYIAPEVPALSATFVYNEIIGIEDNNFQVVPLSVHYPNTMAEGKGADVLLKKTHYLYGKSSWMLVTDNFRIMLTKPCRYIKTFFTVISDALKVGLTNRIGIGIFYRFLVASQVAVILAREKCRHVHANFAHIPTDIAMYAASLLGIPFSFMSHANDLFERGWLLKEKVSRAKFAVTISDHNRRFLMDRGASGEKIHVVHCGVDSRAFASCDEKPFADPVRLGTLGRMVEKKGFDDLIRACRLLKDNGLSFHLEIAGDGPLHDELTALAESLDLGSEISFSGALAHNMVSEWLGRLDMFVLACKKDKNGDMDGIPVVLMESMLCGVPVVSTNISGIPELVEEGVTGFLVPPGDSHALAETISRILSDVSCLSTVRKNAVRKVDNEFNLSTNVKQLAALFSGDMS